MKPNTHIVVAKVADLTEAEGEVVCSLAQAVYPPEESANWAGQALEWTKPEWCVRLFSEDGALVSYVGMVLREATLDGEPVPIGGIGSVKTHPNARRQGYARRGLQRAIDFFHEQPSLAFALLVCEPHLLAYYGGLGWTEFQGECRVRQHGEEEVFTFNRVMTIGIHSPEPSSGLLDLCGPPW